MLYGVNPEDIHWVLSNEDSTADSAGKTSDEEQLVPEGIKVTLGTVER